MPPTKKKTKRTQTESQMSGIETLEWVDPKTLDHNPLNWKKHPHRQRQAISASIGVNGWAGALLYNKTTGKLIDGHCRKEEAIKRGDKAVPVLMGHWTEEQEKHLLATLDPIGAMYQVQSDALTSLTEAIDQNLASLTNSHKAQKDILTKLNTDIDHYASEVESGNQPSVLLERKKDRREYDKHRSTKDAIDDSHQEGIYRTELADDPIFNSSNFAGLPDLRSDVLCPDFPTRVWDRSSESSGPDSLYCYSAGPNTFPPANERQGGTLSFFTEDFRFERVWNDLTGTVKLLQSLDFRAHFVPDFSTWADWPLAVRLHQLYKSRYVARYWQEAGLPIIPIVQSIGLTDFDEDNTPIDETTSAVLCLHTIPKNCPVLATEARNSQGENDYWPGWVALHKAAISIIKPQVLVVYGGVENAKNFQARLGKIGKTKLVLLSSFISRRRKGSSNG